MVGYIHDCMGKIVEREAHEREVLERVREAREREKG